ncbi:unnamed protein product [Chrysodeixis includens]|uniref:tRNA (uracil-O(2)-)-methyltransferase n=1 Tax=Chrysodeixis includens TaxID=689277 RepID=A0A9N8KQX3_CHRIL|nr:unnamed protein product [Chrysodeixis includens]
MDEDGETVMAKITPDSFWHSVNILITKPHIINKRLWGSKTHFHLKCKLHDNTVNLPPNCSSLTNFITSDQIEEYSQLVLKELGAEKCDSEGSTGTEGPFEIQLTEILPKIYTEKQAYQLVCLDKEKCIVTFYHVTPFGQEHKLCPNFTFTIKLEDGIITMSPVSEGETSSEYTWLAKTLITQLTKWATEKDHKSNYNINQSLALISLSKYYEKYNELKMKYGKEMVKIWPECTDPQKFVYEDVAIASYLLVLWEADTTKKVKTFVDLGCGNGLLVYILTQEGHNGLGLDVRKRNIWNMYPPNVVLQERTIRPSDSYLFPEMDYVIGNHSDELSPWIPVIAARSSYKCNFFLLPCCAYDFDGSKYQRQNAFQSQYSDYLDFLQWVCKDLGFKVDIDRLKIPSTKRICFISNGRLYKEEEYEEFSLTIDDIIKRHSSFASQDTCLETTFKARGAVERVRNCTQVDRGVVDSIVDIISKYLLKGCDSSDPKWNIGKTAEINELVQLIPKEKLTLLKSECGGIQTLLKNNHNIFEVQSGKVTLRYPRTINDVASNPRKRKHKQTTLKVQQKPCWFYNNHPQGCPLSETVCSYLHVKSN